MEGLIAWGESNRLDISVIGVNGLLYALTPNPYYTESLYKDRIQTLMNFKNVLIHTIFQRWI